MCHRTYCSAPNNREAPISGGSEGVGGDGVGWKIQQNETSVGVRMNEKIYLVDFNSNGVNSQKTRMYTVK